MPLSAEPAPGPKRRAGDGAATAVAFLTTVPLRMPARPVTLGEAAPWFPLVGALVGLAAGGARAATGAALGPAPASVLALLTLVVVTGALHQDGLADCADGLGVRGDRDRRLAVMRDSAIGVFGALALVLWGLLLLSALAGLSGEDAVRALVVAGALGRWAALLHARMTPSARADGLGAAFAVGPRALAAATVAALAIGALVLPAGAALGASAAAVLIAIAVSAWARRTLGGRTGDTLGATVALVEVAVCLVVLAAA